MEHKECHIPAVVVLHPGTSLGAIVLLENDAEYLGSQYPCREDAVLRWEGFTEHMTHRIESGIVFFFFIKSTSVQIQGELLFIS